MEDTAWILYALLGALLATQVILIVMAAERRAMLVEIVEAIRFESGTLAVEIREIEGHFRRVWPAIPDYE